MKYLKKLIKLLLFLLVFIIFLLIIDYIRLNVSYNLNKSKYIDTIKVRGNTNKYTPQGLTYSDKYDIVLQTSYNSNHNISKLYVSNLNTGKLIKELELRNTDNTSNNSHVGGITTDNNTVWITSDYEVNEFNLEEIITTKNNYIKSINNIKLPNRGDFCTYNNNILWIGDFFLNPFYPVPDNNPLLMGYNLNNKIDYSTPDYIISLPKMVQGMAITPNNKFIFTSSFTNLIKSELSIYDNVLTTSPSTYKINNKNIPYYKFDNNTHIKTLKLPPMAEELFYRDNNLYILFENSSDTYFYAYPKMNKIIKLNIKELDI